MPPLSKHWCVAPPLTPEINLALSGYPPILRQVLYNRGYTTHEAARQYLEAQPPDGAEPANLLGMPQAIERIQRAIEHHEPVAIYGDYDADGVTATALLTQALESLGADVRGYIPNRFDEGYGLNIEALASLYQDGVRLVVTVDCGVRSPEEAEYARRRGLDLIITDHHQPAAELPPALAIINPKQPGDPYPDKDLAGVGLAYKLAVALTQPKMGSKNVFAGAMLAAEFLDLVALGTVSDLAPLKGENRALVRAGLEYIRHPGRQGLMALIGASGLTASQISAENISFALGPRLNAAGRLDSALAALELLTTRDVARAAQLAQLLDNQNRERQQITRQIQEHAEQSALAADPEALLLIAIDPGYNPGVVGLAASRLTEKYYRPAIVAQQGDEYTRASCRSIPEFHITQALDRCADLLVHHGGHAAAAGFTVHTDDLPELVQRLKDIAQEQLGQLDLRPVLHADAEVGLSDLHPQVLKDLAWLQPTGMDNPQAIFVSRSLQVRRSWAVGKDSAHLRLIVSDGHLTFDGIAFRQGHWQSQMPSAVDLMFVFETNEYNGQTRLQLNVRDLKPAGTPDE